MAEQIDTTSSGGKLIFHVFGLAEFEYDLIRERTDARLRTAQARGRLGGRPKRLALMKRMYDEGGAICQTLGISWATLYRHVRIRSAERSAK